MKCLVVGHGPSYTDYDFIKNFDGKILAVDRCAKDLIAHDIIPDYQLWNETSEGIKDMLDEHMVIEFALGEIKRKMTIVYRGRTLSAFINKVARFHLNRIEYDCEGYGNSNAITNVGLYSICFAGDILKADEIHLIGLDYGKSDKYIQPVYDNWIASTHHYYRERILKPKIIDHSGGYFPCL